MLELIAGLLAVCLALGLISLPFILVIWAWKTHWILGTIATVALVLFLAGDGDGDMPSHV